MVEDLHNRLFSNPAVLEDVGSAIGQLVKDLPDPPVDIRYTITASLQASRGCLAQIATLVKGGVPPSPVVLQTLLRTSLLSSGRIVYMLGPEDADSRLAHARVVLRQDSNSLIKAIGTPLAAVFLLAIDAPTQLPTVFVVGRSPTWEGAWGMEGLVAGVNRWSRSSGTVLLCPTSAAISTSVPVAGAGELETTRTPGEHSVFVPADAGVPGPGEVRLRGAVVQPRAARWCRTAPAGTALPRPPRRRAPRHDPSSFQGQDPPSNPGRLRGYVVAQHRTQ